MTPNTGEIAALLTAVCFSASSIFFTQAGKVFGSLNSNRLRLVAAILLLTLTHWILYGSPFPVNAGATRWLWLGTSGVVGLAIGDLFLFQSYLLIGARLGLLFLSMAPALAAVLAWLILGETLGVGAILGILMTLAGIAWVVWESSPNSKSASREYLHTKSFSKGILSGVLAAAGQALGVVLAKNGLTGGFSPISGNVIRMSAAFIALWGVTLIQRQVTSTFKTASKDIPGLVFILGGSLFGPLLGVSLSLYAIQHTDVGIASTLIALPPIFLLPIGHIVYKECISWKAVAGTLVAIAGVAVLFWL